MTTYEWRVEALQVVDVPEPNTVVIATFAVLAMEDTLSSTVTYAVNLLPADPGNFTPYADITPVQAVAWVQDALGVDRVAGIEAELQAAIDAQKVADPTPVPAPLPWGE